MGQSNLAAVSVSAVFSAHHEDLVRLAALLVGDQQTAEDVVQDVYVGLHARWARLPAPAEVLPYVRAAVLNGCRTVLRRRKRASRIRILQLAGDPPAAVGRAGGAVVRGQAPRARRARQAHASPPRGASWSARVLFRMVNPVAAMETSVRWERLGRRRRCGRFVVWWCAGQWGATVMPRGVENPVASPVTVLVAVSITEMVLSLPLVT